MVLTAEEETGDQGQSDTPVSVNERVPIWRIVLLSAVGGAIDLGYAVEGTYATPLLVAAGLDIQYATIMLGLSPLLGAFFQAYLGSLTDQCECKWGRRRPFILILSLTGCLGLLIAPFAPYLSRLLTIPSGVSFSIAVTVIGICMLDFSFGQLQLPSRAYLLDSLQPTGQTQTGNFIYVVLIGFGTLIGFVLSGVDWVSFFSKQASIINEAQFVFSIAAVIIVMALLFTLFSVKEKPIIQSNDEEGGCLKCCPCAKNPKDCFVGFVDTILESLKFVRDMSRQMWLLWVNALFGFGATFTFLLFFTTFVGSTVYGGLSSAPEDSQSYQLYAEGVRMGAWAMAAGAVFLIVASILMDPIAKIVGLRTLYLSVQYLTVVVLFFLSMFPNLVLTFVAACSCLLYQGVFLSVPFTLLSLYQDNDIMFRRPFHSANVEGRACFVINSAVFVSEIAAALTTGFLINLFQSTATVVMITCVTASIAAVVSIFVESTSLLKISSGLGAIMASDEVKLLQAENVDSENEEVFIEDVVEESRAEEGEDTFAPGKKTSISCKTLFCSPALEPTVMASIGFGVEAVYCVPLLLAAGVSVQYVSTVFLFSGLLLLLSQVVAQCCLSWSCGRRRRPCTLLLSLTGCLGLLVASFAPYLSRLSVKSADSLSTAVTIIGVCLLDFSFGQLQFPSTPHLLDTTAPQQVQAGNFVYVVLVGLGMCVSFTIGAIDFQPILNQDLTIIGGAGVLSVIAVILVCVGLLCALTKPTAKLESTSLREDFSLNTFYDSFVFVTSMTKEMWILCMTVLFTGVTLFPLIMFFTAFVSEFVYGGVPSALDNPANHRLYAEGVRMGSWALAIGAGLLMLTAMTWDSLTKTIGLRALFLVVQYSMVLGLFFLSQWPGRKMVFLFTCFLFLYYGLHHAVPFTLVTQYQNANKITRNSTASSNLDSKRAVFVLNMTSLLSKVIGALITSPLIQWLQIDIALMTIGCVSATMAAVCSTFIHVPSS